MVRDTCVQRTRPSRAENLNNAKRVRAKDDDVRVYSVRYERKKTNIREMKKYINRER